MRKSFPTLIFVAASLCLCLSLFARGNSDWEKEARIRKAQYIYGEAQRQSALDNRSTTYELYRRAYELDSTNSDYYAPLGLDYVMMTSRDRDLQDEGINLLRKKFEADPSDYNNAYYYSQVLGNMGELEKQTQVLQMMDSLNPARPEFAVMYVDALLNSPDSTNYSLALDRLRRLEVTEGKTMEFTARIIGIYVMLNDTVNSLSETHQMLAASPLDPTRYSFAGRIFKAFENRDSALYYYRKATEIEPQNGNAAYALSQFYKESGDTAAYSGEIDRMLMETDLDAEDKEEILLEYTRSLFGDTATYAGINNIFDRVIYNDPQASGIRKIYASFLFLQHNNAAAAEQMGYVIDLEPQEVENWIIAAVYNLGNDNEASALDILQRGFKYHDAKPQLHEYYSRVLFQSDSAKNLEPAIVEMKLACELTDSTDISKRSEYLTYIGDFYYTAEQMDSAVVYYEKALATDPGNIMAKNNYAYHLSESSSDADTLDKAEKLSFDTIIEEPENAVYLDTYAWILFKKQEYKRAKEYIDRIFLKNTVAEGKDGDETQDENVLSAEYYSHAGDIYYFNQLPDKALEFWEKALELTPDDELLQRKVSNKTYFHK